MRNIEYEEALASQITETGDKEGTYEQKNDGDQGSNTVFTSNSKTKVAIKETSKEEDSENIIFAD